MQERGVHHLRLWPSKMEKSPKTRRRWLPSWKERERSSALEQSTEPTRSAHENKAKRGRKIIFGDRRYFKCRPDGPESRNQLGGPSREIIKIRRARFDVISPRSLSIDKKKPKENKQTVGDRGRRMKQMACPTANEKETSLFLAKANTVTRHCHRLVDR